MNDNKNKINTVTAASLMVALGIIYGDIGTSPLYVFKAIIGDKNISQELVFGGVSCIFWTLTIQTSFKYIWLTLKADNEGEGGIFSLYSLVKRYSKKLIIPTILGATALLADGIITPPISVASAIEGLEMIPSLAQIQTVPIVIVILSALFFFQRYGTQKVGMFFGPIMAIWFSTLFVLGFSSIIQFPNIIEALNPIHAFYLLKNYPSGFWILGAVFLATTGAEALYSDLGHCGRKNIRITWLFVKLCLVVNYLGQAVWLLNNAGNYLNGRNPFYEMMPAWFLIIGISIATFAAIIASQALISGSYTLISEAINLNFWPRVKVKQPTISKGQIYIPSVNIILWIGCVLMILYFKNSSHMEAAYGFSITIAMMMTTILLGYFLAYKLRWNKFLVIVLLLIFSVVEISFFIANIAKIKERWMFLFFELFIFLTMYVWYYARKVNNKMTKFVEIGKYSNLLRELTQEETIPKISNHLIYLTKANNRQEIEDKIIKSIFAKTPKRADFYWFLHINRTDQPYTLNYHVSELIDSKVYKINVDIGFKIQPKSEVYFKKIISDLRMDPNPFSTGLDAKRLKYNQELDFKFIVIEKFLSVENEFQLKDSILLNSYFWIKKISQKDEKAFGIDKNDVILEYVPLIYQPSETINLKRQI